MQFVSLSSPVFLSEGRIDDDGCISRRTASSVTLSSTHPTAAVPAAAAAAPIGSPSSPRASGARGTPCSASALLVREHFGAREDSSLWWGSVQAAKWRVARRRIGTHGRRHSRENQRLRPRRGWPNLIGRPTPERARRGRGAYLILGGIFSLIRAQYRRALKSYIHNTMYPPFLHAFSPSIPHFSAPASLE